MSDDTHDEMPEEIRAIMEAEWTNPNRRMCLPPALLSGNWRAFLPIDRSDKPDTERPDCNPD